MLIFRFLIFIRFYYHFQMLLYDIIEVVPEPGKPLTKFKLKEIYVKEQKGPVSAISHVLGFLVTAVGQKIYLWQLKDNDLNGVAFIDTNIFVHQITTIKSLLLVADMYKSISLLRFQVMKHERLHYDIEHLDFKFQLITF